MTKSTISHHSLRKAPNKWDPRSTKYSAASLSKYFGKDSQISSQNAYIYSGVTIRPNITIVMEDQTFIGNNAIILVNKLVMKKGSQINAGAILFGRESVTLGEKVVVSYGVIIGTSTDTLNGRYMNDASPESERKIMTAPVSIFDNSFIGANCYITPGVKIGPNSIVGAGAYICSDIQPNKVVVPKQELLIKDRDIL